MNNTEKRTSYFLKERGFFTGFSSILSLFGNSNMFNISESGEEADKKALRSDWEMIGQDFKKSMRNLPY